MVRTFKGRFATYTKKAQREKEQLTFRNMTIMKTIVLKLLFFNGDGFLVFDFIIILTGIGQRGDFDQKRLRIGVAGRWWAPTLTADEPPHNAWHISQILENKIWGL